MRTSLDVGTESSLTESILSKLGLKVPSETREQLILATVLVLFAGVFAARIFIDNVEQPAALLYALPITLIAVEYGARAGLLSAGVALALFAIYTNIRSVDVTAVGWGSRAVVYFVLGGMLGLLSDRLRWAHAVVETSKAGLQAILDNATAVIYVKDCDGRYLLVNRRFEEVFRVTQDKLAGKTDYDLFPKYSADAFKAADRKVLKTREPLEVEEVARHRDGSHTYLSIRFPLFDATGEPYAVCGISTDITRRIQAEQQVRESKEQVRQIIDTAHEAFVSINASSIITGWNRQAEKTFGWSAEQAIGKPITDVLMPERFREKHIEGVKRFLATGEGPVLNKRIELRAVHRDGHEFPIEIAISALRTKEGYEFNAFLHDITQRKRTEELARIKAGLERQTAELRRSNKELAQFAHVASHDLSEPLHTVARYVQLLDSRYKGRLDDDADEFIGFAVKGASRMQELINGLRTYSTLGSSDHVPVPVDCSQVVERAVEEMRLAVVDTGAVITADALPTVMGDAGQLRELFCNLFSNAIKFAGEGPPRVHVSAQRDGESWHFSVADNGIGIQREHAERVFEMFQRLHGQQAYVGTGIGLTISRKIVTRHGGRIWVEPGAEGGSVFRFTVPDQESSDADRSRDGEPEAASSPAAWQ